eukprot:3793297-Prymnesium_polylepis.1
MIGVFFGLPPARWGGGPTARRQTSQLQCLVDRKHRAERHRGGNRPPLFAHLDCKGTYRIRSTLRQWNTGTLLLPRPQRNRKSAPRHSIAFGPGFSLWRLSLQVRSALGLRSASDGGAYGVRAPLPRSCQGGASSWA